MYLPTTLGQAQGQGDCSGWEKDPQSFTKAIAKHHLRTELRLPFSPISGPYHVGGKTWRINFPNKIAVYVTLAKVLDFVVAARWEPKPAAPRRPAVGV